ncbi:FAD-binding protein [Mycobacterium leprae]|uniref:FAD-binding protein n=1 Tax=Mycobacterium leprae TaxID=1769 RepID=UPI0002EE55B1|nr:FAD-binding protein [Mycobacterium leprae]
MNEYNKGSNPAAVVRVSLQTDVQKAVASATANKLKIAPSGGGHLYTGASTASGIRVLYLRGLPAAANFDSGSGNVPVTWILHLYVVPPGAGRVGVRHAIRHSARLQSSAIQRKTLSLRTLWCINQW